METLDSQRGETDRRGGADNDTNAITAPQKIPLTYEQEMDYQPLILETLPRANIVTINDSDQIVSHPSTNQTVKNIAIQSIGKIAGYAITLVTVIRVLALFQNATNYGPYSNVLNYMAVFGFIADGGLMLIGIREASRAPQNVAKIVSTTLALKTFLGIFSYGSAILLIYLVFPNSPPYTPDVKLSVVFLSVALFFTSLSTTFDISFQSRQQPFTMTLTDLISRIIMFIGVVGLSLYQAQGGSNARLPLRAIFFIFIGLNVIINVLPFVIKLGVSLRQIRLNFAIDWSYARFLFLTSLPMAVVSILSQLYYKADALMLSFPSLDKAASYNVGVYNAAYKVTDPVNLLLQVFTTLLFPVLATYSVGNVTRLRDVSQRAVNILLVIIIPISTGLCVLAPGIVAIIANNYPQAALPEAILGISMTFSLLNIFFTYIVVAQNQQRTLVPVLILNIIANVAMNLYAIPHFSYVGTAVVTVISEAISVGLTMYVANRLVTILPSFSGVIRPLIAASAMAGVILALYHSSVVLHTVPGTLILMAVGAAIYGIVIYMLGGIDPALLRIVAQRFPFIALVPGFTRRVTVHIPPKAAAARVSIIITTHNQVHAVKEAIQSVLGQTVPAHEIIVIDDDSFDNTEAVVRRFSQVAYHRQASGGITQARALGASLATGDWFCFLNAADSLEPIAIERWLDMAQQAPQSGLIFGQTIVRDEEHHIVSTFKPNFVHPQGQMDGLAEAAHLFKSDYIVPGSFAVQRSSWSAIGGFTITPDDYLNEWDLCIRVLQTTSAAYIPQPLLNAPIISADVQGLKTDARFHERQRHISELLLRDPRLSPKQRRTISAALTK